MALVIALSAGVCQAVDGTAAKAASAPLAAARLALTPSPDAQALLQWLRHNRDHAGLPFIVIDKRQAQLWVFDPSLEVVATTPVLLGSAPGDRSVPGIGERPLAQIEPDERTTPAGRFVAEPGHNLAGEDIFWIDYDAAVSMHRVRASRASEQRLQRLATPSAADNRISYGCINVPADFYDRRIKPVFSSGRGAVYVLPESLRFDEVFGPAPASALRP